MELCLECKLNSHHCFLCRKPADKVQDIAPKRHYGRCLTCAYSRVYVTECAGCNGTFCDKCRYRAPHDAAGPFICFSCKGSEKFFADLSAQALQIQGQTETALSSPPPGAQRDKTNLSRLLFQFCTMVDLLNSLLQYSALSCMWPLLLRVVEFQEEHTIGCDLLTLQTVRLHVEPDGLHNKLVRHVARQLASTATDSEPGSAEAGRSFLNWSNTPTLAFAVHDVHGGHPIMHLTCAPLKQMMDNKEIKVYIIATQAPNLECAIVKELHTAAGKRWIQLDLRQATTKAEKRRRIRSRIQKLDITVLFDLIGPSAAGSELWRGVCRPGREAWFILLWLNEAALSWNRKSYSAVILDPWMSKAVPDNDPEVDNVYCISSWQPGMQCIRDLPRSARTPWVKNAGQNFRIHTPANLTRISWRCLKILMMILLKLEEAVVCFEGDPLVPMCATLRNMEAFSEQNSKPRDYFAERLEWWARWPMDMHAKRLRDRVHLCVSFGSAEGHTGVHLALGAGVPVLTTEGSLGGGDVAAWVAAGMLFELGLGALVLPNGEEHKIVDRVRQLYDEGRLLTELQHVLDTHAIQGTSLFSTERAARDLTDLAIQLHRDRKMPPAEKHHGAWNFISCPPEDPYLSSEGGRLERTARLMVIAGNKEMGHCPASLEISEHWSESGMLGAQSLNIDEEFGLGPSVEAPYSARRGRGNRIAANKERAPVSSALATGVAAAVVGEAEGAASMIHDGRAAARARDPDGPDPPVGGLPHCVVIFQC